VVLQEAARPVAGPLLAVVQQPVVLAQLLVEPQLLVVQALLQQ